MCECVCVHLRKEKIRRGKSLSLLCTKKREKKRCKPEINKIINTHATVTVYICTITVAIVYLYTSLHSLMWVIFCSSCVKVVTFSILHIYAQADVIALIILTSCVCVCMSVSKKKKKKQVAFIALLNSKSI